MNGMMKLKKKLSRIGFMFIIVMFGSVVHAAQDNSWTWLYQKIFSESELKNNGEKKVATFSKEGVTPFTQLVFSWNAFRDNGHYSFWVKSRNAKTKQWTNWYKMMVWGEGVQRSFDQKGD